MKRLCILLPLIALFLHAAGCDFPADPPVKRPVVTPPVDPKKHIDSAATLLPLHKGITWVYTAQTSPTSTQSGIAQVSETIYGGIKYFRVPYTYWESPRDFLLVLPVAMRTIGKGVAFYDAAYDSTGPQRAFRLAFQLPYPAQIGDEWPPAGQTAPFGMTVKVAAKDTVITDLAGASWNVYRYDVRDSRNKLSSLFVLPGKAILRIATEDVVINTVSWGGL
jgi:hypothetical protein